MILVLTIDDGMELGCLDGTDEGFGFDDKARTGRRGRGEVRQHVHSWAWRQCMICMLKRQQQITSHRTSDDGLLEGIELGWLDGVLEGCSW